MIPQAMTNTGPYADLWSHLKAMQHAVDRALRAKQTRELLTELDRERLTALADLLRSELSQRAGTSTFTLSAFAAGSARSAAFALDVNLAEVTKNIPEFRKWHEGQGFEKKIQRLIQSVEAYVNGLSGNLFPATPPETEFILLDKIIGELLLHTESSLQV